MYDFELRERADEDAAAPNYHNLYHNFPIARYWDDDFLSFVRDSFAEGDRVLDLGCGPASLWEHWSQLPAPARVVGVDISPGMIEQARASHPEGEFHVARAHALPFPDGSFDLVVASAVRQHIPGEHLPGALAEITRVLDEHGRLVGREPNETMFGQEPGWFSGSIMTFRHFVFRLTRSREFPEPPLGAHHGATPRDEFVELLGNHLHLTRLEDRYPFSPFVLRVRSEAVATLARTLDAKLSGRRGAMYYFAADRNFADIDDVRRIIEYARTERGIRDGEFLAYLEQAAAEIERLYDGERL